MFAFILV